MTIENDIEQLQKKLDQAKSERDSWKNKSAHHYELGSKLVEAYEKQIRELISKSGLE